MAHQIGGGRTEADQGGLDLRPPPVDRQLLIEPMAKNTSPDQLTSAATPPAIGTAPASRKAVKVALGFYLSLYRYLLIAFFGSI